MTAKNKRPAAGRASEISGGDNSHHTVRSRPHARNTACMPMSVWVHWEIRRYLLETEAPGIYGIYGQEDAK